MYTGMQADWLMSCVYNNKKKKIYTKKNRVHNNDRRRVVSGVNARDQPVEFE